MDKYYEIKELLEIDGLERGSYDELINKIEKYNDAVEQYSNKV